MPKEEVRYNEMEDLLLDELSNSIANSLIMANSISETLERQNRKLDVIGELTDANNKKLNQVNKQTLKLLR